MNENTRRFFGTAAGGTGVWARGSTAASADGTPASAPATPFARTVTRTADRLAGHPTAPVIPFVYEVTGGVGSTAYGVAGTAGSAARAAAGHAHTGAAAAADTVAPARGPDATEARRG
ncbi:hypothetical protein AB0N31_29160 [Streptomyces sp. NPDC051051]|uniref:hypothetical protein n=1 Tax=Streptomyces sp. NPDC051051 TaxID=3155666 RepID=UPI00343831B6